MLESDKTTEALGSGPEVKLGTGQLVWTVYLRKMRNRGGAGGQRSSSFSLSSDHIPRTPLDEEIHRVQLEGPLLSPPSCHLQSLYHRALGAPQVSLRLKGGKVG